METNSTETLELAVKELLEEQLKTNQYLTDLGTAVNGLSEKINTLSSKIDDQDLTVPEPDLKPVQKFLEKGFLDMMMQIQYMRKEKVSNWQIFLQSDGKKWFVILFLGALFLTYCFILIRKP